MRVPSLILLFTAATCGIGMSQEEPSGRKSTAIIVTSLGKIVIRLDPEKAPQNVAAFLNYVSKKVYENSSFWEKGNTWIGGGKPSIKLPGVGASGNMSPDRAPPGEFDLKHKRGVIGFRRTAGACNPEKRSNCTQFYISTQDNPSGDGEYSVFGTVEEGMEVADAIMESLERKEKVSFSVEVSGN